MRRRFTTACIGISLAGFACGGGSSQEKDAASSSTPDASGVPDDGPGGPSPASLDATAYDGTIRTDASKPDAPAGSIDGGVIDVGARGTGGTAGRLDGGLAFDGGGGGITGTGTGPSGVTCDDGFHDGGDGLCLPFGSFADGYHDGGDGSAVKAGSCRPSFHDGGDGTCVSLGSFSPGYHDGGAGKATPVGTCDSGYHNDGTGLCTDRLCRLDYHDGGDGQCRPVGGCSIGYHIGKNGDCVHTASCGTGEHDGGNETCVPVGACSTGFHDGGNAMCVPSGKCVLGYETAADGTCAKTASSLRGLHDGGDGTYVPLGTCSTGYHDDGTGKCVASGCAGGFEFHGECVPRFSAVSCGRHQACALRTNGRALCWSTDGLTFRFPPQDEFQSISAGGGGWRDASGSYEGTLDGCGLKADGTIVCWGTQADLTPAPSGPFASVSVGGCHACGLKVDGTAACWGCNRTFRLDSDGKAIFYDSGQAVAPAGQFTAVSAGACHSCGVKTDGTVACWGCNESISDVYPNPAKGVPGGQTAAPTGTFLAVNAGTDYTCGIKTNREIACWGYNDWGTTAPPAGKFVAITSTGKYRACAVKADGTAVCWGGCNQDKSCTGFRGGMPARPFRTLAGNEYAWCGVTIEGELQCDGYGLAALPPTQRLRDMDGGSCRITRDGIMTCGGFYRQTIPGVFVAISGADNLLCALKSDATVACWKQSDSRTSFVGVDAPAGTFSRIRVGGTGSDWRLKSERPFACGLRTDGAVVCWGDNGLGQTSVPAGTYIDLSAGATHACAVATDGTMICWGDNSDGAAAAPPGAFVGVAAGAGYTCGLKADGKYRCWGYGVPSGDQSFASPATAIVVAVDLRTAWGFSTDGSLCIPGQACVPGPFVSVAANVPSNGSSPTVCGIGASGFPVCWGYFGISP
jgi:hypothetical protein